jgi:hypothetical protein
MGKSARHTSNQRQPPMSSLLVDTPAMRIFRHMLADGRDLERIVAFDGFSRLRLSAMPGLSWLISRVLTVQPKIADDSC